MGIYSNFIVWVRFKMSSEKHNTAIWTSQSHKNSINADVIIYLS